MFDLIINEVIYLIIIAVVLYFIGRLRNQVIKLKKIIAISVVIVSIHFLTSFTLTLWNVADIWFPFILNINSDFPKPKLDYDIQNLLFALIVIYSLNFFGLVWGLINLIRMK